MMDAVVAAREEGGSLGGVVSCVCRNVPAGWGEPVFDKAEAKLAHAMMSLPATKGFEIGSGLSGTRLKGSAHNDPFEQTDLLQAPLDRAAAAALAKLRKAADRAF